MKGKLPVTGVIALETGPAEWRAAYEMKDSHEIDFRTTGIIMVAGEKKYKINLVIDFIHPPETVFGFSTNSPKYPEVFSSNDFFRALKRMYKCLDEVVRDNEWIIFGRIPSNTGGEDVEVLLIHYANINVSFYTQKLIEEKKENFFNIHPEQAN